MSSTPSLLLLSGPLWLRVVEPVIFVLVCSVWPTHRGLSGATTLRQSGPGNKGNIRGTPHSPNLQSWSLTVRLFSVIIRTLNGGVGVLPLCRDVANVFSSPSWQGLTSVLGTRLSSIRWWGFSFGDFGNVECP